MFVAHWSPGHDKALKDFENHLRILNRSPNTIESYVRAADQFFHHAKEELNDLDSEDVLQFLLFLKNQNEASGSTLNQKRSALRLFFSDILGKPLPRKLLKFCRKPKRLPEVLTAPQVSKLLQSTDNL